MRVPLAPGVRVADGGDLGALHDRRRERRAALPARRCAAAMGLGLLGRTALGHGELGGELVWFVLAEESDLEADEGWYRRCWLLRIEGAQLSRELSRHTDF